MISVYVLKNQIEAQVIDSALKEASIKFIIRTFEDTAYNGIFVAQRGYGQVLVEKADQQRAEEIIKAVI